MSVKIRTQLNKLIKTVNATIRRSPAKGFVPCEGTVLPLVAVTGFLRLVMLRSENI